MGWFFQHHSKNEIIFNYRGTNLPKKGKVFLSIDNDNKEKITVIAKKLQNLNFKIVATQGTANYLKEQNIIVDTIKKVKEGSPHIVDALLKNEINLVINTTKSQRSIKDSYSIRRTSLMNNIPYYTTIAGAKVAVDAIENLKNNNLNIKSLQSIH